MTELLRDLRFGARLLAKSPVFAATAVVLLAIGISANTLIFSLVNALLLRPLPVSHPENLVRLVVVHPNDFLTWEYLYNLCDAVAAGDADLSEVLCQGEADIAFSDGRSAERLRVHFVSPNFFSSLSVQAQLGRVLTPDDERTAAMNAVLSYDFWRRRFDRDPSVLGRSIILGGHPFTIVGVLPELFNGLEIDTSPAIRVPAAVDRFLVQPSPEMKPPMRPVFGQIFGRLRNGVTLEKANADVQPLLQTAYQREMESLLDSHLLFQSITYGVSTLRTQFSRGLELLMAGVALLLLMACANVAGLLLARSAVRSQEFGIRLAIGASPARVVRQLLTEGMLLALLSGLAGVALTRACLPLITRALPPSRDRLAVIQPLAVHINLDFRVLGFTIAITFLTAVLFALAPALSCARADLASILRGSRTMTQRWHSRNLIVAAQVAVCTLILIGADLLVETLERMRFMNPGFDRDHVVTFTIDPHMNGYTPEQVRALNSSLLEKVKGLPGVVAASMASRAVMRGTGVKMTIGVAGSLVTRDNFLNSSYNEITPGYFETMGMRLLAGRDFDSFDGKPANPRRVIVNETFARHFFAGRDTIGGRFGLAGPDHAAKSDNEIIGIVSDAKYRSLREPIPPTFYSSPTDGFNLGFSLHVRTRQRPEAIISSVRGVLRSLDSELPIIEALTLREEVEATLWQERLLAWLSAIFGGIAALLASIGLYGTLDYAVKSRMREIGIRIALGAQPARIVGLFSRETVLLVAGGIALGLGAFAGVTFWIRRILYEVRPWDPAAIASVVLLVGFVAVIAAAPALYRAVRVDPMSALRME